MSIAVWTILRHLVEKNDKEPITFLINSMGGGAHDMFAIADAMELCPVPIRTIGTGMIASAATLILSCGSPKMRYLTQSCQVMTHDLQWGAHAGLSELQAIAEAGKKMELRYHTLMAKHGNKSVKEIRPHIVGSGNWMTATEAIKKLGIADHILKKHIK